MAQEKQQLLKSWKALEPEILEQSQFWVLILKLVGHESRLWRDRIGIVLQSSADAGDLTVLETLITSADITQTLEVLMRSFIQLA